MPTLLGFCQPF